MKINKIVFRNFMPYFGLKTFDFDDKLGTYIIFGNSNTGKTSFIRGIRYLFFNTLMKNNDDTNFNIKKAINTKAFDNGEYSFFVYMEFEVDGTVYKLKRQCSATEIFGEPTSDNDFKTELTLRIKDSEKTFTQKDIQQIIEENMPEEISEFMLFDGENILKYVEILNNDGPSGSENLRIKEAINKIIGAPYLTRIISRLQQLGQEIADQLNILYAKRSQNDKDEKELKEIIKKIESINQEKGSLEQRHRETRKIIAEIGEDLNKNARIRGHLEEKSRLKGMVDQAILDIGSYNEKIKNLIIPNIRNLQHSKLTDKLNEINQMILSLETKDDYVLNMKREIKKYTDLLNSPKCLYCGGSIDEANHPKYKEEIVRLNKQIISNRLPDSEELQLSSLKEKREETNRLLKEIMPLERNIFIALLESIITRTTDKNSYINSIKDQEKQIGQQSEDVEQFLTKKFAEIKRLEALSEQITQHITENGIKLSEANARYKKLISRIRGYPEINLLEKKAEAMKALTNHFIAAKEKYIVSMRKNVEKSASEIFMRFIENENSDIKCLNINENYRMKIVMKNESIMNPGMSYNTLLALSLIFGLNRNSNLFGTIFFDAAFSVLQNSYTNNIIKTFNDLAPQLILLTHKERLEMDKTRTALGTRLVKEFEIYQEGDSFDTKVKEL